MAGIKKDLIGCTIGIDLENGDRIIGEVHTWSSDTIWVNIPFHKKPIDVPREITQRILVCLKPLDELKCHEK
jgi:hypothetical protein